jgi:transcriptional regulator with XRE-family HTH domain
MRQIENELKDDRELARLTRQEELILDITELILEKMEQKGLNKSQLAEMLGTNKSHITQLLRGSRNMTLRTVSDIFFELDYKLAVNAISDKEFDSKFKLTELKLFVNKEQKLTWQSPKQYQKTESKIVGWAA